MLVTDIVQRAVSGRLRFDFIESTITAMNGGGLSSQKGRAHCDPGDGCFLYHFQPRGSFRDEWIGEGGYFNIDEPSAVLFNLAGVERSSSTWIANDVQLRLARGSNGLAVHGHVHEWTRIDERSVQSSFTRVIVPGHFLYPTTVRHAAGHHTRGAIVSVDTLRLEFRDYGDYTEISAINTAELPENFAECAVSALARVLDRPLAWVYRERHSNRHRIITVQHREPAMNAGAQSDAAGTPLPGYNAFWNSYSEELTALL